MVSLSNHSEKRLSPFDGLRVSGSKELKKHVYDIFVEKEALKCL